MHLCAMRRWLTGCNRARTLCTILVLSECTESCMQPLIEPLVVLMTCGCAALQETYDLQRQQARHKL